MENKDDKNKESTNSHPDWKKKFDEIINTCSDEIKRTAAIGKNMFNASNANSKMNESFEEIGRTVYKLIKDNKLKVEDPRVMELVSTVEKCGEDLSSYEAELNDIKSR